MLASDYLREFVFHLSTGGRNQKGIFLRRILLLLNVKNCQKIGQFPMLT